MCRQLSVLPNKSVRICPHEAENWHTLSRAHTFRNTVYYISAAVPLNIFQQ